MADPVTLGTIGLASSGASGALGIFSSLMGGGAKADAYKYQSSMAWQNAAIAKQNQKYALDIGEQQAERQGIAGAAQAGQIKAGQAASGVDVNTGSAKEVQTSQHLVSQMDLNTIREKAAKTAYDFSVQATNYENQAKGYSKAASNAKTEGVLGAVSSFIGTVGSVSSKWLQGNQLGMWGNGGGSLSKPGPDPLTEWEYGR
jgi:hypothetical protein